jgi:hypothetical protein
MTRIPSVGDQILIDLFRWRHSSTIEWKSLDEYRDNTPIVTQLVESGLIHHLGEGLFRITLEGQKTITDKYPELWKPL